MGPVGVQAARANLREKVYLAATILDFSLRRRAKRLRSDGLAWSRGTDRDQATATRLLL